MVKRRTFRRAEYLSSHLIGLDVDVMVVSPQKGILRKCEVKEGEVRIQTERGCLMLSELSGICRLSKSDIQLLYWKSIIPIRVRQKYV